MTEFPQHRRKRIPRVDPLPTSLPPIGLSRVKASAYIGVSPTLFDQLVDDGRMPKPRRINTRLVWSRLELDEAFAELPTAGAQAVNPFD